MPSPLRIGLVAALAIGCHYASAQTAVPPAVTVQRAAPQLVAFAGSQANFQNLVTGLAQGTQVQLFTVLPDGSTQIVTFTPAGPVPLAQIPQLLEAARQQLIGLGIGNPTAEQLATTLMGGIVPTALGGTQVSGTLASQNPPSPAVQAQANAAVGASAPSTQAVSVQTVAGATSASPPVITSDSPIPPGATSRSPIPSTPTATGLPGPEALATPPAPGERPSAIQRAPVQSTAPAPAVSTAQPGNTNSALRATR